jgi:hypothetical protein
MNILLIAGHGAGDPGACAQGYEEADLTREVVSILADKLEGYADVEVYPIEHSAYHDLSIGDLQVNWTDYDYVLEVHFNAGGGEGTEIYVTRIEEGTDAEECIMNHLENYFTVRGVKRMNFNVIYSAKKAGVSSALLETCFIDSESDMDTYENDTDGVVQAIADGIIEAFGLGGGDKPQPEPTPEPQPEPQPEPSMEKIYQNGSTAEPVYCNQYMTEQIGELSPYERCVCIGTYEGLYVVRYKIDATEDDEGNYDEKIGFVAYDGIIN